VSASAHTEQPGRGARIVCDDLWKIYGPDPARHRARLAAGEPDAPDDERYTVAVAGVSFELEPGETFVVMGLSGSGKSTLIRCLTRLIEPTAGDVSLDGRSIVGMSEAELRALRRNDTAMVFQHFGLLPHRTVLDNVAYGLEVAGVRRAEREARAQEMLGLVGLGGQGRRYPAELSGGMRQRVGLARALAVRPRLLLLDEPFSALDPLIRRDLQDELLRLAQVVNQTMVFITHDMSEALKLGDRIAVMRNGHFVQVGTPEEIVLSPKDDYVRRFAEDAPRLRVVRAEAVAAKAATLPMSATVGQARETMRTVSYGFVVDGHGRPLSLLTPSDLDGEADPNARASDVAGRPVVTVLGSAPLQSAIAPLADRTPVVAVVDEHGAVDGALDHRHLLHALDPSSAG
jgi:glycine betaine/proline transport system ATP-binding protein